MALSRTNYEKLRADEFTAHKLRIFARWRFHRT